jgi:hypothetical protein
MMLITKGIYKESRKAGRVNVILLRESLAASFWKGIRLIAGIRRNMETGPPASDCSAAGRMPVLRCYWARSTVIFVWEILKVELLLQRNGGSL